MNLCWTGLQIILEFTVKHYLYRDFNNKRWKKRIYLDGKKNYIFFLVNRWTIIIAQSLSVNSDLRNKDFIRIKKSILYSELTTSFKQ